MIDVQYFASIREQLGTAREQITAVPALSTVGELLDHLASLHGETGERVLKQGRVLMAVNQRVARAETPLADGDEVAFFPPVTGG